VRDTPYFRRYDSQRQLVPLDALRHPDALGLLLGQAFLQDQEGVGGKVTRSVIVVRAQPVRGEATARAADLRIRGREVTEETRGISA
jgi:hypothetical protein